MCSQPLETFSEPELCALLSYVERETTNCCHQYTHALPKEKRFRSLETATIYWTSPTLATLRMLMLLQQRIFCLPWQQLGRPLWSRTMSQSRSVPQLAVWKYFGHFPLFEVVIPASLARFAGLMANCFTWLSGTTTTLSHGSVKDACSVSYANGAKAEKILDYRPRTGTEAALRISCEVGLIHRTHRYPAHSLV